MEMYPNYNETATENTTGLNELSIQLKELKEVLGEREEELQLWRMKQDQYVETLSFNSLLEEELCRANEEIFELKSQIKNFITREQVLINEFSIDAHIKESYSILFSQYQEAVAKIEGLQISLEESKLRYQKLLPYVHRLIEVEANFARALKNMETVTKERTLLYA